jgi:hypothetical protein
MVCCGDCELCEEFDGKDGKKFYGCLYEYKALLKTESPQYWTLTISNPQILEKKIAVNLSDNRQCSNYCKKRE